MLVWQVIVWPLKMTIYEWPMKIIKNSNLQEIMFCVLVMDVQARP